MDIIKNDIYAIFNDAVTKVVPTFTPLVYKIQGNAAAVNLKMRNTTGVMPFTGSIDWARTSPATNWTIYNKQWHQAVDLEDTKGRTLENDSFKREVTSMVDNLYGVMEYSFYSMINNGETSLCYTGDYFFSDSHTIGLATIDNLLTGTGTDLSDLSTDLNSAINALALYKQADNVNILHTNPISNLYIVCPPALYMDFATLATAANIAGSNNVLAAYNINVIMSGYLSDANDWFLMKVNGDNTPFFHSIVCEPYIEEAINETTYTGHRYAAFADFGFTYNDPRYCIKIKNT